MGKNIKIIYFSGTGNTKMVAEMIGESLRKKSYSVSVISLKEAIAGENDWEHCVLGFGYPVYAIQYPEVFDELLAKLPVFSKKVPAFIFSTKGTYDGDSRALLARELAKKNIVTFATETFKCPNNCFVNLLGEKRLHSVIGVFDEKLEEKVEMFSDAIQQGIENHFKDKKKVRGVNPFFRLVSPVLKGVEHQVFKKFSVDESACGGCGLCAKNCPAGRIHMEDGIVRYDAKACMGCMRCVSDCPKGAITFAGKLHGRKIYSREFRAACKKEAGLMYYSGN